MVMFADFAPDSRILVSISGGADSIYLTWLLAQHFSADQLYLLYFDHGLRSDEAILSDQAVITKLCDQLQLPHFEVHKLPVRLHSREHKQSLETTARQLRRSFLYEYALKYGCSYIALGHHWDDHIETALFQLIRGTQSQLTGIKARTTYKSLTIIRPLLEFTKADIMSKIHQYKLAYNSDDTNTDERFTRNKIRHQLLPVIADINPNYREKIGQFIAYHQETQAAIYDGLSIELATVNMTGQLMILPLTTFQSLATSLLQKNWIRYAIKHFIAQLEINPAFPLGQLNAIHIDSIFALFLKETRKTMSLPAPFFVEKQKEGVCFSVKL